MNTLRPMASKRSLIERALLHPYFSSIRNAALAVTAVAALLYPKGCHEPYHTFFIQQQEEGVQQREEERKNPLKRFFQKLEELAQNQELIAKNYHYAPAGEEFNKALRRVTHYNSFIVEASRDFYRGYPSTQNLLRAMAIVESEGNPTAISPRGARGLLQVTPETAQQYHVKEHELFDPELNLRTGSAHLLSLARRFEDPVLALMGYNAGPEKIERVCRSLQVFQKPATIENLAQRKDLPRETKEYPLKVLSVYKALQAQAAIQQAAYTAK